MQIIGIDMVVIRQKLVPVIYITICFIISLIQDKIKWRSAKFKITKRNLSLQLTESYKLFYLAC